MSEVHPDEAIRDAARECEQEVSRFYSDLALDREMYDALAAVDVSGADADTQRFLAHTLRDYRRAGVDKPPEVRARLKQIDEELTKLGQQFSKNISEDVRAIEITDPRAARRAAARTSSPRTRPTRPARSGSPPTTPTTTRS